MTPKSLRLKVCLRTSEEIFGHCLANFKYRTFQKVRIYDFFRKNQINNFTESEPKYISF